MARGINKVILIGNLGADPDVRSTANGVVANIRVATTSSWKDKNTGERQDRTEWHNVVLFNQLGETAQQYLKKGSQVYIEGALRTRKWTGDDNVDRYTTEIVASDMQMLGGKPAEAAPAAAAPQAAPKAAAPVATPAATPPPAPAAAEKPKRGRKAAQPAQAAPAPAPAPQPEPQEDSVGGQDEGFDDDIPF